MTKVNANEILRIIDRLDEINVLELKDIQWVDDNDNAIAITPEQLEEWKFTGLANSFFVEAVIFGKEEFLNRLKQSGFPSTKLDQLSNDMFLGTK